MAGTQGRHGVASLPPPDSEARGGSATSDVPTAGPTPEPGPDRWPTDTC